MTNGVSVNPNANPSIAPQATSSKEFQLIKAVTFHFGRQLNRPQMRPKPHRGTRANGMLNGSTG